MSFTLKVFGGVSLAAHAGPLSGSAVQRHRLAVLAVLAVSHPRAVSRDKLLAWLWPSVTPSAPVAC
jgi:DNA-binding SARP family transcriptional activator